MKRISIFLLVAFFGISSAFAIDAPKSPGIKSTSNTSITVEWQEVQDAIGYFLYYDTTSGQESGIYKQEISDLIEDTQFRIENLTPSTDYYIAITAVDLEANESSLSPELQVRTTGWVWTDFALEEVQVTGKQELTLMFSTALDTSEGAEREFLLMNAQNDEEIFVVETSLDEEDTKKLVLMLDRELETSTSYNFTIISITDQNGKNIESGIDAITNFETPTTFPTPQQEVVETTTTETTTVDNNTLSEVDLNSAWEETLQEDKTSSENSTPEKTLSGGNGGQIIKWSLEKDVASTAEETEKLPQTGPEHILLLLLALALGASFFHFYTTRKRS